MKKVTVLVSAAGSTNGVNVIKALRNQKDYDVEIIAIDSSADAAGLYLADKYEIAPKVTESAFEDFLSNVCRKYCVNVVMPTHSVELPFFSAHWTLFEELGAGIVISPPEKIKICDDKLAIARFFKSMGVSHPRIYDADSISEDAFPLLVKPRFGSGSSYASKVNNGEELEFYFKKTPNPVVQEYIEGTEYTVNIVSDSSGRVLGSLPARRVRVRGGLSVVAQAEEDQTLIEAGKRIVEALGLVGPSNVQVIVGNEERVFIEVNPRFASGTLPLAVAAGLNIPLIMLKLALRDPVPPLSLDYNKRMIKFWDSIIISQSQHLKG